MSYEDAGEKDRWGMINRILDMSIKKKMQLSFVIISIVPLLILGTYSYQKTVDIIEALASRHAMNLIREVEFSVTNEFYEIDDLSKLIVDTKSIINILKKSEEDFEVDRQYYTAQVKTSLTPFILNNDYVKNIYILSDQYDASFRAMYYDGALYEEDKTFDYKDDERYASTKNGYNNNIWWIEKTDTNTVDFVLTRKIYDASYGFLGILVIEISNEIMDNAERISNDLDNSQFYILNEKNTVMYNENTDIVGQLFQEMEMDDHELSGVNGSFITGDGWAKDTLVVYNHFLSSDWKLILLIPYTELIKEVDSIRYFVTAMIVIMTLIAIFLSMMISSSIYNPLKKIMESMSVASKGDVSVRVDVRHKDDIGELGDSFNGLMSDMELLLERVKYEQQEKAKLHVQVLEYQMNPHFLYNTFATMYWMAMEDGNYKLAQMSNALSNYFKLGLNNGEEVTTVGNEVKHVEDYLVIQRERSSGSFDYEIEVDESIKECQTVKILLQPIAENAIMHGFRGSERSDKKIRIRVSAKDGYIEYSVEDNGIGIEDAEEKNIEYFVDKGIGLGNTIKRLRLYYNNDFTFNWSSEPGESTIFTITVPFIAGE